MGVYRPHKERAIADRPRCFLPTASAAGIRCSKVEQLKLQRRAKDVAKCMSELGLCVVDNFLGADLAQRLLRDAERMRLGEPAAAADAATAPAAAAPSELRDGGGVTRQWIADGDAPHEASDELLRRADAMVQACERRLGPHVVSGRTKAMLVRYPPSDAGRSPRVDNARGDARCLTCIYYLNKDWNRNRDGGQMKVYTAQSKRVATIEPLFDRLVLFWSDKRSVCQLLPAATARHCVVFWYLNGAPSGAPAAHADAADHGCTVLDSPSAESMDAEPVDTAESPEHSGCV